MPLCNTVKELFEGRTTKRPEYKRSLSICFDTKCSLKCNYCVNNMPNKAVQDRVPLIDGEGPEKYLAALDKVTPWETIDGRVSLVGSGEPTESKHFVALARLVLERGAPLGLSSNLQGVARIERAVAGMVLKKEISTTASYHRAVYDEAKRKRWLEELLPRAIAAGVAPNVIVTPMAPPVLAAADEYLAECEYMRGLWPRAKIMPIELYHQWQGRPYPASYTQEERETLHRCQRAVGHDPMTHGCIERDGRELRPEALPHIINRVQVPGQLCYVAVFGASIAINGQITNCAHTPQTFNGHLTIKPPASLYKDRPAPCPARLSGCKAACNVHCLSPHGVDLADYFFAWYTQQGKHDIADLFR